MELYTWNLYNFINQYHLNKFDKNNNNKERIVIFINTQNFKRIEHVNSG